MSWFRAAIIGAGPAGFYACEDLLKRDIEVDLYDALPTPFGLVRAGVAPDHPKLKTVTRRYAKTARHPNFRFFSPCGTIPPESQRRLGVCSRTF